MEWTLEIPPLSCGDDALGQTEAIHRILISVHPVPAKPATRDPCLLTAHLPETLPARCVGGCHLVVQLHEHPGKPVRRKAPYVLRDHEQQLSGHGSEAGGVVALIAALIAQFGALVGDERDPLRSVDVDLDPVAALEAVDVQTPSVVVVLLLDDEESAAVVGERDSRPPRDPVQLVGWHSLSVDGGHLGVTTNEGTEDLEGILGGN